MYCDFMSKQDLLQAPAKRMDFDWRVTKDKEDKGGGDTSADSFPKVSKILYMEQMVLPGEIEG